MDRRTFLTAGGAAAALTLTGAGTTTEPVFEWSRAGGLMTPPLLALYPDNTAYADATASFRLPAPEAAALRTHALRALERYRTPAQYAARGIQARHHRDALSEHAAPGIQAPHHRDALSEHAARGIQVRHGEVPGGRPVDRVWVRRHDGGRLAADLEVWADPAVPATLPDLDGLFGRVQGWRRWILRTGEPWRPNAVLLATVGLSQVPDSYRDWPAGVPTPPEGGYAETRLRGPAARSVRRALPAAAGESQAWPACRTADGSIIAATWRHLLPHE